MIDKVGATPIQEPVLITGNPVTTKTQASDIAAVTIRGDTTVTKPNPDADISPDNIAVITGISNPAITAVSGAASNSQTIAAELHKAPRGTADEYDGQSGTLIKRIKKLVLDGTENWEFSPNGVAGYVVSEADKYVSGIGGYNLFCTHYKPAASGVSVVYFAVSDHRTLYIWYQPGIATLEAWKAYLAAQAAAGTPVTVYYPLDRPVITEARHDLACYDGVTTFSSPSVPAGNMDIKIYDGRTAGKARDADYLAGLPPSAYIFCPDNLLDNWDMRSPVNQRAQASYTGNVKIIDRWFVSAGGANITITLQNGYLKISNTGNSNGYIRQVIGRSIKGLTVTLSALVKGKGYIGLCYLDKVENSHFNYAQQYFDSVDYQIVTLTTTLPEDDTEDQRVIIRADNPAGSTSNDICIVAAELVTGSVSYLKYRLQSPPDYAAELVKCQRYLLPIETYAYMPGGINQQKEAYCIIPTPVTMRPTAILTDTTVSKYQVLVGGTIFTPTAIRMGLVRTNCVSVIFTLPDTEAFDFTPCIALYADDVSPNFLSAEL